VAGDVLQEVAEAARLREGAEGVRALLRVVHAEGPIRLRDAAVQVHLPLPVAAAVRREMEKRGLLTRDAGMRLSESGRRLAEGELGIESTASFTCPHCGGRAIVTGPDHGSLLDAVREALAGRPAADVTLDQSHGTPETALRRALLLCETGLLAGRDTLFLGDDDLVSIAAALARRHLGLGDRGRLAIAEVDPRLADHIRAAAQRLGVAVEVHAADLRQPLPAHLTARFDGFVTDPPYTVPGAALFVSRGVAALRPGPMRTGLLSFGHKDPGTMARVHLHLAQMGLAVVRVLPRFNDYEGAAILGNTSQMIELATSDTTRPLVTGAYTGSLYTADQERKMTGIRKPQVQDRRRPGSPTPGAGGAKRSPGRKRPKP